MSSDCSFHRIHSLAFEIPKFNEPACPLLFQFRGFSKRPKQKRKRMLKLSVGFFLLSWLALDLGLNSAAGLSFEFGRVLFFILLGMACLAFIAGLMGQRRPPTPN